jgi:hypothetical protein
MLHGCQCAHNMKHTMFQPTVGYHSHLVHLLQHKCQRNMGWF